MLEPEEIERQQARLAEHRRRLAVLLQQQASLGEPFAPPGVAIEIANARAEIQRIKVRLRASGLSLDDAADDIPTPNNSLPHGSHLGREGSSSSYSAEKIPNIGRDYIGRDKIGGDKVEGNKSVYKRNRLLLLVPILFVTVTTTGIVSYAIKEVTGKEITQGIVPSQLPVFSQATENPTNVTDSLTKEIPVLADTPQSGSSPSRAALLPTPLTLTATTLQENPVPSPSLQVTTKPIAPIEAPTKEVGVTTLPSPLPAPSAEPTPAVEILPTVTPTEEPTPSETLIPTLTSTAIPTAIPTTTAADLSTATPVLESNVEACVEILAASLIGTSAQDNGKVTNDPLFKGKVNIYLKQIDERGEPGQPETIDITNGKICIPIEIIEGYEVKVRIRIVDEHSKVDNKSLLIYNNLQAIDLRLDPSSSNNGVCIISGAYDGKCGDILDSEGNEARVTFRISQN
jgi:hypothetical protein